MRNLAVNPPPTKVINISHKARRVHLAKFLNEAPTEGSIWVFAVGSLIWRPEFDPVESLVGKLYGYSRQFNFWTIRARGQPSNPGLGLGLEPDQATSSCIGKVFRLKNKTKSKDLEKLWNREMFSGVYTPTWCPIETNRGIVDAICFVTNKDHRNYAGYLPEPYVAEIIFQAEGQMGRCREYLDLLVLALEREGIHDDNMLRILDLVNKYEKTTP
mgnify:FL=1